MKFLTQKLLKLSDFIRESGEFLPHFNSLLLLTVDLTCRKLVFSYHGNSNDYKIMNVKDYCNLE